MANVEAIVQEGIAAVKAGRRDEGRRILVRATELDEQNEQAWLWLSGCVDSLDEQRICLENVLAINPANQKARRGLDALSSSAGASRPAASTPSVSPFADSGFDTTNPYAGTGFDSNPYGSSSNDPAIGTGWSGFDAGQTDSSGTTSSVEWGNPDRAPAYGSGKNVPTPSSDDYDQWVSSLQLGNTAPNPVPAAGYDTGFDPLSGPFGSSAPAFDTGPADYGGDAFNTDPYGGSRGGSPGPFDAPVPDSSAKPFGNFPDSDAVPFNDTYDNGGVFGTSAPAADTGGYGGDDVDFFGSSQPQSKAQPYNARSTPPAKAGGTSRMPEDLFPSPVEQRSAPAALDDDILFGNMGSSTKPPARPSGGSSSNPFGTSSNVFGGYSSFADQLAEEPSGSAGTTFSFDDKSQDAKSGLSPFFSSIPSDIQVRGGGGKLDLRLVLTVGALALLNAISLGALVLNLLNR